MNTIQKSFQDLSEKSELLENLPKTEFSLMSQPIDKGAKNLLTEYKKSVLKYPPFEVEYLIQTLNEHITNCLDIRMKAQDLEILAFSEISDNLLQRQLIEILQRQIKLCSENEPKLLANMINPIYQKENGSISGDQLDYWSKMLLEQETQLKYKLENADKRLARLSEAGGGTNYVARFEFLKKLFDIDLIEAYCRARSASAGLKGLYGINLPVPELTDIGYLDHLAIWARKATYELEKKLFKIREITLSIPLHDGSENAQTSPMTLAAFNLAKIPGVFVFSITEENFQRQFFRMKNPKLKGIDLHIHIAEKTPATTTILPLYRATIMLPSQKINIEEDIDFSYNPSVYIPMCSNTASISDLTQVYNQREVYNNDPFGEWTIKIDPKGVTGAENLSNGMINLLIRMRVSYERG